MWTSFLVCVAQIAALPPQAPLDGAAPAVELEFVASDPVSLELVESAPVETTLDHADLRNAAAVWVESIGGARRSLDFAEFYASDAAPSALTPVIEAIEAAASRGVRVRFLAEEKFYATYPETLDRLAKSNGVEVRRFDVARAYGGVLHAKYFVVDAEEVYVGSQNFDWRSLEHIFELGLRIRAPHAAAAFQGIFDADWAVAGGASVEEAFRESKLRAAETEVIAGARVTCRFSPRSALPDESWWDLPLMVEWIDGAKRAVDVEVLTYKSIGRDKTYWDTLESALRRAAARGVKVRLLTADWAKRRGTIEGLQSLAPLANVDVRMTTIPAFSGGHVPFARVAHAKYMLVDGERVWLGTSNWERDYFEQSRNASVFVEGGAVPQRVQSCFDELWSSTYAYDVDPCATYEPPRVGD